MSYAEMFLMGWAILSTVFAVMYSNRAKFYNKHHRKTAVLLAEVVTGEVTPVLENGMWVVENEEIKMSFKKVEG